MYLGGNITQDECQNDDNHNECHVLFTRLLLTTTTTSVVQSQQDQGHLKVIIIMGGFKVNEIT